MKSSIRTILGYVAIITLYYSPAANGIRSSSSHTLSSLESIDRRIGRATVLNTRGGVTGDDALVSIVPRATLPKSISGMSMAYHFRDDVNYHDAHGIQLLNLTVLLTISLLFSFDTTRSLPRHPWHSRLHSPRR